MDKLEEERQKVLQIIESQKDYLLEQKKRRKEECRVRDLSEKEKKLFRRITYEDAKGYGLEEEWLITLCEVLRNIYHFLPVIPKGGINFYDEYLALRGYEDDKFPIMIYIELRDEYKGKSYAEIMRDIRKKNKQKERENKKVK